ncbi:MAG: hypothetical protein GY761_11595, partial [Hyphomicrobiales bacterium]|nr:hypothetical protein [Hyphomicrobiales bacterium]
MKLTLHGTVDEDTGSNRVLVTTPGHHFFDIRTNSHMHISEMLKRDGGETRLTLEKGEIVRVTAESILYSAETADMFEQAEMLVTHTEHGLALKPEMRKGW